MRKWTSSILGGAILIVGTMFVTSEVVSQQQDEQMQKMQEEMAKWMELAKPAKEHADLMKATGSWKQQSLHWMAPGAPPVESKMTAEFSPILGGRYMAERTFGRMDMGAGPIDFEGYGIFGYDRMKEKHFFVWFDNMGTGMMYGEGEADATGNEITYMSEYPGMDGEMQMWKSVSRMQGDQKSTFEMHQQMPDGTWFQVMQINSVRN